MWLSEQKPDMFTHKLEFILLPQLIYSYTKNYACSMPPLANVGWSAFPECCQTCKSMTGEMVPKEAFNLAMGT